VQQKDTTWTKLFVGGLPYHTTDKTLRHARSALISHMHSNELTRAPPELVQQFRLLGGIDIGATALHVLNLIWFGYFARLSQWGGGQ